MQPLTRRTALRGAVAIGAAGVTAGIPVAAIAAADDAEIMRLYREWQALSEKSRRNGEAQSAVAAARPDVTCHDPEIRRLEYECDAIEDQRIALENAIAETPAATLAGVQIKLALAVHWIDENGDSIEDRLAVSVQRDIERLARGGVA